MFKKWNYQSVLNVLMTLAIVLIAFPVLTPASEEVVPMAIQTNGTAQYVNFTPPVSVMGLAQRTIVIQIYQTAYTATQVVTLENPADYVTSEWYDVAFNSVANGDVVFEVGFSGGNAGRWKIAAGTLALNTQYQIVITYDATSTANDPVVYVNGSSVGITEISTPAGTVLSTGATRLRTFGTASNSPTGKTSDVRIYNFVATAADIANIYASRCINVHPAAGLPVFQPVLYGAAGLQAYDGVVLGTANLITDPYSGARGVPTGSPVGVAETYLTVNP